MAWEIYVVYNKKKNKLPFKSAVIGNLRRQFDSSVVLHLKYNKKATTKIRFVCY